MTQNFRYFVIFAEMRTGSNFLESNLNAFDTLHSYGEAFNPEFIGYPNKEEILGIKFEEREADPQRLLDTIISTSRPGQLSGFRYFSDHDPRIFETIMNDPSCAKIILTRNPVDSYVSWRIAQNTGQWKLTNVKRRKDGQMSFDGTEFDLYLATLQERQVILQHQLQKTGQTAFYIAYDDINDLEVINGIARFLGTDEQRDSLDDKLKRQNPDPLSSKVTNYDEMTEYLAGFDRFDLDRTPNFEPRRGAVVPSLIAGERAPLLFMPIPSAPTEQIAHWMAALDGVDVDQLKTGLNQRQLRKWLTETANAAKFTVLRHPVARAHHSFCNKILSTGADTYPAIRRKLRNFYKLPLPGDPSRNYTVDNHKEAFKEFLRFIDKNLNGQTSIRVDAHWATQFSILQGMSQIVLADQILREDDMVPKLDALAKAHGYATATPPALAETDNPYQLSQIYDDEIESLTSKAYRLDYLSFGFSSWKDPR